MENKMHINEETRMEEILGQRLDNNGTTVADMVRTLDEIGQAAYPDRLVSGGAPSDDQIKRAKLFADLCEQKVRLLAAAAQFHDAFEAGRAIEPSAPKESTDRLLSFLGRTDYTKL
jgi:hypothetical protein